MPLTATRSTSLSVRPAARRQYSREASQPGDVALVWLLLAPVLGRPDRMSRTVKLALRQTS
ncbi:hypothetical protein [Streptomyces cinerochromogenes]|uniref:hypothetical protein n=1 Tax=Streptomyces cinerochromogenes TaxID=66422 RepID=UPI0033A2F273